MKKYKLLFVLLLVSISYAQITPKNILLQTCLFSYQTYYKHLEENKAFAYARVALGEEDTCAWSYKASSLENARISALNACKQKKINAPCKIVDINNTWLVQKGDFSTIIPPNNMPLSAQQLIQLTHKAQNIVLGKCLSIFNMHLQDKGHKVFAYSVDEDGRYACGTSHEHQTLRQAALVAIETCEAQRNIMQKESPKHPCLSFSDGNNILAGANDFKIILHKKTNKFLDVKSYNAYVNKVKKYLSKPCLAQYKYYLRVKDHKAFYIAKDSEGNIACGHSFEQFTISSAKKQARKKCETSAKFKKITQVCTLFDLDLISFDELERNRIKK